MNKKLILAAMLNCFPQGVKTDYKMLLDTYESLLAEYDVELVKSAAKKFMEGSVKGQSKNFPPSTAEFLAEVRNRQEMREVMQRREELKAAGLLK